MPPKKRLHPETAPSSKALMLVLSEADRKIYELIKSRKNMGIEKSDMKNETGLATAVLDKAIKSLENKHLIKDVINIQNKRKKVYMAVEFEPADELTGGTWYSNGSIDQETIQRARRKCMDQIEKLRVATIEEMWKGIQKSDPKADYTMQQVADIVKIMVLDGEVEEVVSTGMGVFSSVQAGRTCYKKFEGGVLQVGGLASVPCGVCPRIRECTPDSVFSPKTCIYYQKWLQLDF